MELTSYSGPVLVSGTQAAICERGEASPIGNSTWENALDPFPIARGAAFNTFTTAKDVSPTPLPVVYGNELRVGSKVELEAWGEYSGVTGNTFRLGFAYGITSAGGLLSTGIELCGTALTAMGTTPTAWPWHLHYGGVITAVGTSGVIYGSGILDLGSSLTAIGAFAMPVTAAARSRTPFDTTIQKAFSVFAEFGTSAAGNQVIVDKFTAHILNQGKTA